MKHLLIACLFVTTGLFAQNFEQKSLKKETKLTSEKKEKVLSIDVKKFSKEKKLPKGIRSGPTKGPDQFHIDFVGTANLQQNINQANESIQGSAGLGVIFERYLLLRDANNELLPNYENKFLESIDMEAYINVASSIDSLRAEVEANQITNRRLFGTYILNPVSPKQSIFINTNLFFNVERDHWLTNIISGANIRINASNVLWNFNDATSSVSRYGGVISFRAGLFYEFLPNNKIRDDRNRRKYSVRLGLAYSARSITGDISSDTNNDLRNRFLGTTDRHFRGFEPFFGFRLNNIIAEFTMPMLRGSSNSDIAGLTDTQFQFSIRFVGGFSLKIGGNSDDNNDDDSGDVDDD